MFLNTGMLTCGYLDELWILCRNAGGAFKNRLASRCATGAYSGWGLGNPFGESRLKHLLPEMPRFYWLGWGTPSARAD